MARMAWFKKERKPRTSERVKLEIPADAWEKCDQCGHVDIRERFVRALNVCPNCGHHRRISAQEYIDLLVDEGSWHELFAGLTRHAIDKKTPLILVSASGGARMQEGVLSLMQMAKTSVVIAELQGARVPFMSVLTNPTTGGVSASYAMQGDVILAEPGAVIGFAGPRVIKQTIGQDLPEGFQTAEFLLDHGMIDAVVPRGELRDTAAQLLRHMTGSWPAEAAD